MGFIVNDHDKGIHGEARSESFVIYRDKGNKSIELLWEQMDELEYIIEKLKEQRNQ